MSALVDQGPLADSSTSTLDLSEETANQLTHGFGLLLSVVGAAVLVNSARAHGDALQFIGCCVYAASLVALYAASTLSHSFRTPSMRHFFRMLDQVCIFLLIAGTFTPFALSYFRHGWLWGLTLVMWGLTCVGIFFKVCFRRLSNVSIGAYVLLAWIPLIAMREIIHVMPGGALALIFVGGMLYLLGILFLILDEKYSYFHAVWHVLVMSASVCHYCAVMLYVIPSA
ncbi:MAG TPA: hemolysin III family protein [Planctomycetaceae bacterium]|jgi:hemolysin III|nr:hemolysin III family protein [Planctomycetaceae bacterium]